jgi:hypothetical protein
MSMIKLICLCCRDWVLMFHTNNKGVIHANIEVIQEETI